MLEMVPPARRIGALAITAGRCVGQHGFDATTHPPGGNRGGRPHRPKHLENRIDVDVSDGEASNARKNVILEAQLPIAGVLRITPGGLVGLEVKCRAILKGHRTSFFEALGFAVSLATLERVHALSTKCTGVLRLGACGGQADVREWA